MFVVGGERRGWVTMEKVSQGERVDCEVNASFVIFADATAPIVSITGSTSACETDTSKFVGLFNCDVFDFRCWLFYDSYVLNVSFIGMAMRMLCRIHVG